jgi:hypothetical protein
MADFIFNISLGKHMHYASLPAATDSLIVVLLKTAGLEADSALRDHDTLAALLAAANDEATFTNYVRKTLAASAPVVDDAANRVDADAADITYTAAGGADNTAVSKAVICYVPASADPDSAIIPVAAYDCAFTPDTTDQVIAINAAGWVRASAV